MAGREGDPGSIEEGDLETEEAGFARSRSPGVGDFSRPENPVRGEGFHEEEVFPRWQKLKRATGKALGDGHPIGEIGARQYPDTHLAGGGVAVEPHALAREWQFGQRHFGRRGAGSGGGVAARGESDEIEQAVLSPRLKRIG